MHLSDSPKDKYLQNRCLKIKDIFTLKQKNQDLHFAKFDLHKMWINKKITIITKSDLY